MSLPRSRNFTGLLSTVPGVQYEGNTGGLSVDGATGTENMWYMDGADITQIHVGTQAQSAVMELIEEVKVTASGYNAEFGGSMGGVVNVITRSGGNAFHGDLIGYYDDNGILMQGKEPRLSPLEVPTTTRLASTSTTTTSVLERRPQPGLTTSGSRASSSLGGYIVKDRLWFFGSFNPQYQPHERQPFLQTSDAALTADVPVLQQELSY